MNRLETGDRPDSPLVISRNRLVEEIVQVLPAMSPDWEMIALEILQSQDYQERKLDWRDLRSWASELWLKTSIETLAQRYPRSIDTHPIPEQSTIGEKTFATHRDHFTVYEQQKNPALALLYPTKTYAEYDAIIEIDGLPVIWEVKMMKNIGRVALGKSHSSNPRKTMHPYHIDYFTKPVRDWYEENRGVGNFGYVVVFPPEHINPRSEVQQRFQAMGGMIVPFYTTFDGFQEDLLGATGPMGDIVRGIQHVG